MWVSKLDQNVNLRRLIFALLMVAGIAARLFIAWSMMDSSSSDHGVPCLMAKHIAQGRAFPVFYYGQPYMGSLEPALGALLCRLFGVTGFAVNLGTALFGIALLPIVYAWGRRAGGALAGLVALSLCVVGPFAFFQFQGWSYGGYAAIVFFTTLLVYASARMVERERTMTPPGAAAYFGIGLAAGAAWWTAPHTLPAIATAALLFVLGVRAKLFGWRAALGIVGFFVGSAPFWLWNARHHWETLAFLRPGSGGNIVDGVRVFFGTNMFKALGVPNHPLVWICYVLLWLTFILVAFRGVYREGRGRGVTLHAFTPILYLLVAAVLGGGSRFAGPNAPGRYLLHVVPVMAVVLGCVTRLLAEKVPWGLGLVPVALLLGVHLRSVPIFVEWHGNGVIEREVMDDFGEFLQNRDVRHVYATYPIGRFGYALNFLMDEMCMFSDPMTERFGPYRREMEVTDSVGVLRDLHGISTFLAATGGSSEYGDVSGLGVHYDFKPPPRALEEIEQASVRAVDQADCDVLPLIGDGDLRTVWRNSPAEGTKNWIEIEWPHRVPVHAVRLLSEADEYGHDLRVEWRLDDGQWAMAPDVARFSGYFWSGPRPYLRGGLYRQEFRFGPFETTAIRLHINQEDSLLPCSFAELRMFAAVDAVATNSAELVMDSIETLGLDAVYADRWMANRIHTVFDGRVASSANWRVFAPPGQPLSSNMRWTAKTGVVASRAMAATCRRTFADAGFSIAERDFGDQVLFYFSATDWQDMYALNTHLEWTGLGCLKRTGRAWAMYQSERADLLKIQGDTVVALDMLAEAVALFRGTPDGMSKLVAWSDEAGDDDRARYWRREKALYDREMSPSHPLQVAFSEGMSLEGLSLSSQPVVAGGFVDLVYFWRCPPSLIPADWAVFVHFVNESGDPCFQDDHVFLDGISVDDQPVPVLFRVNRRVSIPSTLAPGRYRVSMGVYSRTGTLRRLRPKAAYPVHYRAVLLPVDLSVVSE